MTSQKRVTLIAVTVTGLLVAAEVAINIYRASQAEVEVMNQGDEPIEGLTITVGSSRVVSPRIAPGARVWLYLPGGPARPFVMTFHQTGNPIGSYEIPEFDPGSLNDDGFKMVLNVRRNEVERFQDDADPATPIGRLLRAQWERMQKAVEASPTP